MSVTESQNSVPKRRVFTRMSLLVLMASAITLLSWAPESFSQSPQQEAARRSKASDEEIRSQMLVMSRQLGVSCMACHETDNFTTAKKAEYKVAKEHMRLVQVLIDNGMNGQGSRAKADCYLCHRGELKPKYKEPVDPLTTLKSRNKTND